MTDNTLTTSPPVAPPISAAAHTDSLSSLSTTPAPIDDENNLVPLSVIQQCLRSGKPLPSSYRRSTFDDALSPDNNTDRIIGGTLTPSRKLSSIRNRLRSVSRSEALMPSPTPASSFVKSSIGRNKEINGMGTLSPPSIHHGGYTADEMIDIVDDLVVPSISSSPAMTAGGYAHEALCEFSRIINEGKKVLVSIGDIKGCGELDAFEKGLLFAARGHFLTVRGKEVECILENESTECFAKEEGVSQVYIHDLVGDDVDDLDNVDDSDDDDDDDLDDDDVDDLDDDDVDDDGLDHKENEIDEKINFDDDKILADIVLKELSEENSGGIIVNVSFDDEGDDETNNRSHKNNEMNDNIGEPTTLDALDENDSVSNDENDDWSYSSPRESIGRYSTTKMTRSGETPVRRSVRLRNSLEDCMDRLNLEE